MRVRLDLLEDVEARHVGQVEIEQDQQVAPSARLAGPVGPEKVFERRGPIAKRDDLVVDAGPADVALDQARMPLVILDHHDADRVHGLLHAHSAARRAGSGSIDDPL